MEWTKLLSQRAHREYIQPTGRGATAIYLALVAKGIRGKEVLLPNILCPSPANAVLYSGNVPVFCDMDPKTFNFSEAHLRTLIRRRQMAAVLLVHLYGYPVPKESYNLLRQTKLFLIEDACQATGGETALGPVGSLGHCSVFSFGRAKILDVGDGGAILTNDENLYRRVVKEVRRLPKKMPNQKELAGFYRKLYYTLIEGTKISPVFHQCFASFPTFFKDLYHYRFDKALSEPLTRALRLLESSLGRRRDLYRKYQSLLRSLMYFPTIDGGAAVWRATGLVYSSSLRTQIVSELRRRGKDVSTWYPPLHRWYPLLDGKDPNRVYRNSLSMERRLLNLWVDARTSERTVLETCRIIWRVAKK